MRAPTVTEAGQALCALMVLVGLFMILPLPWFLVIAGAMGVALFWAVEYFASAPPTESDGA
jgi:hypothetical protein